MNCFATNIFSKLQCNQCSFIWILPQSLNVHHSLIEYASVPSAALPVWKWDCKFLMHLLFIPRQLEYAISLEMYENCTHFHSGVVDLIFTLYMFTLVRRWHTNTQYLMALAGFKRRWQPRVESLQTTTAKKRSLWPQSRRAKERDRCASSNIYVGCDRQSHTENLNDAYVYVSFLHASRFLHRRCCYQALTHMHITTHVCTSDIGSRASNSLGVVLLLFRQLCKNRAWLIVSFSHR